MRLLSVFPASSRLFFQDALSIKTRCTLPNMASLMRLPCASLMACNLVSLANLMACVVSSLNYEAGVPGRGLYKKLKL